MKRLLIALVVIATSGILFADIGDVNFWGNGNDTSNSNWYTRQISTGAWIFYNTDVNVSGTKGKFIAAEGLVNINDAWIAPAAADTDTYKNFTVSTSTLKSGTSTYYIGFIGPIYPPQDLCASFDVNASSAIWANVTFYGVSSIGENISEVVVATVSTNAKIAYTNNCFSSVSTMTVSLQFAHAAYGGSEASGVMSSVRLCIGSGEKIGLTNKIQKSQTGCTSSDSPPLSAAEGSPVLFIKENSTAYSVAAGTVSATYNYWRPITPKDGNNKIIGYKAISSH